MAKVSRRTFNDPSQKGILFLNKSSENYLSARILYKHGQLFDAGILSHEALEKVMKALLYLSDPMFNLGSIHDLEDLRIKIETKFFIDLSNQVEGLNHFEDCYKYRYPDTEGPQKFTTSSFHFVHLDAYFFYYHDLCLPLITAEKIRNQSGIYDLARKYFLSSDPKDLETILNSNQSINISKFETIKDYWHSRGFFNKVNRRIKYPGDSIDPLAK